MDYSIFRAHRGLARKLSCLWNFQGLSVEVRAKRVEGKVTELLNLDFKIVLNSMIYRLLAQNIRSFEMRARYQVPFGIS